MDNLDKSCGFTLLMLQRLCPTGYGNNSFGLYPNSYATSTQCLLGNDIFRQIHDTVNLTVHNSVQCKAVPLQAWSCPEGSRKLRFPDFMTTAQDGGKVVSLTHRPPLPPGNAPGTHFC